jgi:hypothetical protein
MEFLGCKVPELSTNPKECDKDVIIHLLKELNSYNQNFIGFIPNELNETINNNEHIKIKFSYNIFLRCWHYFQQNNDKYISLYKSNSINNQLISLSTVEKIYYIKLEKYFIEFIINLKNIYLCIRLNDIDKFLIRRNNPFITMFLYDYTQVLNMDDFLNICLFSIHDK